MNNKYEPEKERKDENYFIRNQNLSIETKEKCICKIKSFQWKSHEQNSANTFKYSHRAGKNSINMDVVRFFFFKLLCTKMHAFVDRGSNSLSWCYHRLVFHSQSDEIDAQKTCYSHFHLEFIF